MIPVEGCFMRGKVLVLAIVGMAWLWGWSQIDDDQARILNLENAWNRSVQTKDTAGLDMLLAPELVYVGIERAIAVGASRTSGERIHESARLRCSCHRRRRVSGKWHQKGETVYAAGTLYRHVGAPPG
jgi:hypothetical protein